MSLFVLTRSAYGPAWSPEANRRRLEVTRATTAPLMAAQTDRDWTWVVLLDVRDPLYAERAGVFAAAAPRTAILTWDPEARPHTGAPWARHAPGRLVCRIAASAYGAPWRDAMGFGEPLLQVRLDDDDGLAPDALERYRRAAAADTSRRVLMLPRGLRVWMGRYTEVRHERNAMHCLVTPADDRGTVYDYGHSSVATTNRVVMVDDRWGWLWVRHRDTISGWKTSAEPITPGVRAAFPADWAALEAAWRPGR